jgi:hypothetical protein
MNHEGKIDGGSRLHVSWERAAREVGVRMEGVAALVEFA